MQRKIERWLEKLPEGTTSIVLRAGETRQTETILERWEADNIAAIVDEAVDLMEDEIQGRLIAYGDKGRQLRSVTIRNDNPTGAATTSDTAILVEGLLKMADEQRRFLATITDTFETMHETVRECMHTERDTQEEIGDLQIALAMAQMEQETQQQSTADKALGIFSQVLQQKAGGDAVQTAKDLLVNNPDLIDSLLADEAVVEMVMQKINSGE
jgi:stress response protein SCP2